MNSRALRFGLITLFVGILAGAAYVMWNEESQGRLERAAAREFDDRVRLITRSLLAIKAAQPGYVAVGQGDDFWVAKVDALMGPTRDALGALRSMARTAQSPTDIEAAAAAFEDFEQMDHRAREYARSGQRLLASDLVFSDGLEKMDAALSALDRARAIELTARDDVVQEHRRAQLMAILVAAATACLVIAMLAPVRRAADAGADQKAVSITPAPAADSSLSLQPIATAEPPPAVQAATLAPPSAVTPPPSVDLSAIAALCTDLARVIDTRALPSALERAASVLDASGIVVWIADPDGRELTPIVAHGYPQQLVMRMGTIERDAQNVTAAAFRTGMVQTLPSDAVSHGAIAAPLLTAAGPVGVMAAEVLNDREREETTRAVAAIVAAQLATLMGPPSSRARKAEVAG